MSVTPLPHLWRRDHWSMNPPVRLQVCCREQVQKEFWCEHLEPELIKPVLLFRVLEVADLAMLDPRLAEWTVTTSTGWKFSGFEKLEEPCVSQN